MTRTIKPGLPRILRDLNDAVGKASRTVFDLHAESSPEAFEAAADELYAAFAIARELSRPGDVTGCSIHPQGAIDPDPVEGWGDCLHCNISRRRASAPVQATGVAAVRRAAKLPEPRLEAARPEGYAEAAAKLGRLSDLGGASLEAARAELGADARYEDLVMHAAAHPVLPAAEPSSGGQLERDAPAAPSCTSCGTALDPDGGCFTCATADARGAAS